jgi:hypothetical protein
MTLVYRSPPLLIFGKRLRQTFFLLQQQLADRRQAWNCSCPIFRIPLQVLAKILCYINTTPSDPPKSATPNPQQTREMSGADAQDPPWNSYNKTWPQTRLICREFRSLVDNTPQLWSFIDGRDANEQ